jgi:GTP-binding protein
VGKSSLLNSLLGRKNFARVSKEPGKTRTVNFYLVDDRFYFVDLPGYGYAKVSAEMRRRWRRVIFDYLDGRDSIGGVIQLVDSRHPPMKDDLLVLGKLLGSGRPFIVVMTKADKIGRGQRAKALRVFQEHLGGAELMLLGVKETGPGGKSGDGSGAGSRSGPGGKSGSGKESGSARKRYGKGRKASRHDEPLPVVFFSAKTGEGRDAVWRWIADRIK